MNGQQKFAVSIAIPQAFGPLSESATVQVKNGEGKVLASAPIAKLRHITLKVRGDGCWLGSHPTKEAY